MFQFPESLTIYNVKEYQEELIKYIRAYSADIEQGELTFNAENLQDLDAAGLQLLLALAITLKDENLPYKIINKREYVTNIFNVSGVLEILDNKGGQTVNE